MEVPVFTPAEFVSILNQSIAYAFPKVSIIGELESFKIAKGKWVYADLKDSEAKLRLFGTVFMLPGPLEDGMMVEVVAEPKLHPQFGFSLNMQSIRPVGEGSLKKAADKLVQKLQAEGLFDQERKRPVPYPPEKIALVTANGSAALADFIKITTARWPLVGITLHSSSVQGTNAPDELLQAIAAANQSNADVAVVIRGGGSLDDLSAFNDERVVRSIASSRLPSVVAIGHESDTSLAELAADLSASTPSNAAELLVPDMRDVLAALQNTKKQLAANVKETLSSALSDIVTSRKYVDEAATRWITDEIRELHHSRTRFTSYHPKHTLFRGYALLRRDGRLIKATDRLATTDNIEIERLSETAQATVVNVERST